MAKKFNFKNELVTDLPSNTTVESSTSSTTDNDTSASTPKLVLPKKKKEKTTRKSFPLYMEKERLEQLDKICKKTGYNRNELINKMIEFSLEHIGFE